jgi:hypothetical protein
VILPDPVISVGLVGAGVGAITRGLPILVEVLAVHPDWPSAVQAGIPLSGSPTWASRVRLEVTAPGGALATWPVVLLGASPASVTLDGASFGELKGYVSPGDSAALASGTYTVQAVLDASSASSSAGVG